MILFSDARSVEVGRKGDRGGTKGTLPRFSRKESEKSAALMYVEYSGESQFMQFKQYLHSIGNEARITRQVQLGAIEKAFLLVLLLVMVANPPRF
jgi:hypothetical protein